MATKINLDEWEALDSETQEALIRWFNCTKVTKRDKERLARLATEGRFWRWNCLLCEEPCVHAEPTDEEWRRFQGAYDDIDMSYFGNQEVYTEAALLSMCNACRCHRCKDIPEGSPAYDLCDVWNE